MGGTQVSGSCVGATVGVDGFVEHEDPGRQTSQLDRLWSQVVWYCFHRQKSEHLS